MRPSGDGSSAPFAGEALELPGGERARMQRVGEALVFDISRVATDRVPAGDAEPAAGSAALPDATGTAGQWTSLYTLGKRPMEQHLVDVGAGRLQALPFAFDPAAREWFDLFDGEAREPGEYGHWLGRGMNANSRCIACHTTGFRKGYDPVADAYSSEWEEMGVGCEACHGPGAAHVDDPELPYPPMRARVLATTPAPTAGAWGSERAAVSDALRATIARVTDVCATCHGLHRALTEAFTPGAELLDHYAPVLLDEGDYWSDGQVRHESYEWGSFLNSRMHTAGVHCLSCHDVHSGELRASGNSLCLACHSPELADRSHTRHADGSTGSQCTSCHMPETVFMGRDRRRDHSFPIPDPVAALELGIPSACETCHEDLGRPRLAEHARQWWPVLVADGSAGARGTTIAARRHLARAIEAARGGSTEGIDHLRDCAAGHSCDRVWQRAAALRLLAPTAGDAPSREILLTALGSDEGLVRMAAAAALGGSGPRDAATTRALVAASRDRLRAVRNEAAWALRDLDESALPDEDRLAVQRAFSEWIATTDLLADEPESQHNRGLFFTSRGDAAAAEQSYRLSIRLEPRAVAPRHNLAMLLVALGRTSEARTALEGAVEADEGAAASWYALGLVHAEDGRWDEAARAFAACLRADGGYPGALGELTRAYLEAGVPNVARLVLTGALEHPQKRTEALTGLLVVALESGDRIEARRWAKRLVEHHPPSAREPLIAELLREPADGVAP